MLISCVILLELVNERPRRYLGKAIHALFLELIQKEDPQLAYYLHEGEQIKPFTVSPLMFSEGKPYLRFTIFEEKLSRLFLERVLPSFPEEIVLDEIKLKKKGIALTPQGHPWASQGDYKELFHYYLFDQDQLPLNVELAFYSPTTFHTQGRNEPLPLPELVFGSLVERWNAFSPLTVSPEVKRYAEKCLAIAQCQIRTKMVMVSGGKQIGFLGKCRYHPLNRDAYWLRVINLLASFSFFSGVGYKTTMGMGQVRRQDASPLSYRARCDPS